MALAPPVPRHVLLGDIEVVPPSEPCDPCRPAVALLVRILRQGVLCVAKCPSLQRAVFSLTELYKALAEIHSIRSQLARGMEFRGYGPSTLAATGLLALLAALIQQHWLGSPSRNIAGYLLIWVSTAAVSLTIISTEAVLRARRVHYGLAMEMVQAALEHFLPAIVAGLLLTVVVTRCAPSSTWMLPGLWQVLFSLGVFASCRFLPRPTFAVGVWYLTAGLVCVVLGARAFSPWAMGIPFGVGQLLVAAALQFGYRRTYEPT